MGDVAAEGAGAEARASARARRTMRTTYTAKLGRAICRRVAMGETITAICRDEGMPNRGTVSAWSKGNAQFARILRRAQAVGGWDHERCRRPSRYCEATAMEIFGRLCEGESMKAICEDPAMPGASTVARWRAGVPEFAERIALARQVQAERFADLGWEIASKVTAADAYPTHVKLMQLRWNAAAMAPDRFGRYRPVEAAIVREAPPVEQHVLHRHFMVEERVADGACRVVAFTPDPVTRQLVREVEDGPWSPVPPALAARWRSPADSARAGGMAGVNAPPPLRDGERDPSAERWPG